MIAHVGGVPLEETLLALVSGTGAWLLTARAWVASRRAAGPVQPRRGVADGPPDEP